MGTNQSTPAAIQETDTLQVKSDKAKDRKGIHLAEYKCRRKKALYNKCYTEAYKRFIDAQAAQAGHECATEFDDYRLCVMKQMKKQLVEKGDAKIHPESMLAELDDDDDDK